MGRRKGSINYGNFAEAEPQQIEVFEGEMESLPEIYTNINKDFIQVNDMMNASGLSYDTCARIIRQIKSVSDVFGIQGVVHRTDYFLYLKRKFNQGGKSIKTIEETTAQKKTSL